MNKNVNGYNHSVGKRETTSETLLGNNYEHCCCCKEWFVGLLYFTQLHRQAADQQKSIVKRIFVHVHVSVCATVHSIEYSDISKINTFIHTFSFI